MLLKNKYDFHLFNWNTFTTLRHTEKIYSKHQTLYNHVAPSGNDFKETAAINIHIY